MANTTNIDSVPISDIAKTKTVADDDIFLITHNDGDKKTSNAIQYDALQSNIATSLESKFLPKANYATSELVETLTNRIISLETDIGEYKETVESTYATKETINNMNFSLDEKTTNNPFNGCTALDTVVVDYNTYDFDAISANMFDSTNTKLKLFKVINTNASYVQSTATELASKLAKCTLLKSNAAICYIYSDENYNSDRSYSSSIS